jgi:anti-sigma factor RsiW
MTVTRDVIYDLLPAYFAGEASGDTKTLVEGFFATDPEFGRMAERFRTLHRDLSDEGTEAATAADEREAFNRAMQRVRRQKAASMWTSGAAVAFAVAALTPYTFGLRHPGNLVGLGLAVLAAATWLSASSTQRGVRRQGEPDLRRSLTRKRRRSAHHG